MAGFGKKVLGIIKAVAPKVATGLGGPLAGMVTSTLVGAFGGAPEKEVEEMLLSGNPEAMLKLREAENALEVQMRELDIKEDQLHAEDRQSARDMAKAKGIWAQFTLTMIAILGFGAVLYVLVLQSSIIPPENKDIVIFLVGQLATFVGMGYAFFLGSSKGSQDKNFPQGNNGQSH